MDPAKPHLTVDVRSRLKEIKVDIAVMPASTTYKFQLIDVAIGKPLKDGIYEEWARWMLEENDALGYTAANNRKHPTRPNILDWFYKAWLEVREETVLKTVPKVHMQEAPGPEIAGYVDEDAEEPEVDDDELQF